MASYSNILIAYKAQLTGERDSVSMGREVLLDNPMSIPEHTDFMTEVDKIINELANIQEKIEMTQFLIKAQERRNESN